MGGASGVGSNQLAAPLGPGIAAAGVEKDRPDAGIVICAAHEGGIAVGRQRYRVALVGASAGYSVALSATGDTAIVGGWGDNSYVGAVGGVRSQQGSKLLSNDAVGPTSERATRTSLGSAPCASSSCDAEHRDRSARRLMISRARPLKRRSPCRDFSFGVCVKVPKPDVMQRFLLIGFMGR